MKGSYKINDNNVIKLSKETPLIIYCVLFHTCRDTSNCECSATFTEKTLTILCILITSFITVLFLLTLLIIKF